MNLHFIPYVSRPDLLADAIQSCVGAKDTQIVVVDNRDARSNEVAPLEVIRNIGLYDHEDVLVWGPEVPLTHSQLMNWMLDRAVDDGASFYTWMHHDGVAIMDALPRLIAEAEKYELSGRKWGVLLTRDPTKPQDGIWNHVDVLSAVNVAAMREIGGWNWIAFPDVYSDYVAYGSLVKAGYEVIQTGIEIRHQEGSTTVKSDPMRRLVSGALWNARGELWAILKRELGIEWPPQ